MSTILRKYSKLSFSGINAKNRDEPVIYSNNSAIDSRCKHAQFFVGNNTLFAAIYSMKTDSQFFNKLEDCISDRRSMSQLVSNTVQTKNSKRVSDTLHALGIGDWQSEPYEQH